MMDLTDRHARYFMRQLSRQAVLYTEMITTGALIHGHAERHLRFSQEEHPIALQLGGIDPKELSICAEMAEQAGYDEVNVNVGCPSDRVQSGRFGACLMKEPRAVADAVAAMQASVSIAVTVKTRIGLDQDDTTERLYALVDAVVAAGARTFIIHARNAWLQGLSPKENRDIPPLRYDVVHQLKRDRPQLEIILNGGIRSLEEAAKHLLAVDGVMLGRAAYYDPSLLASVDSLLYGSLQPDASRTEAVRQYVQYVKREWAAGVPLTLMTRPLLGLYQGVPGARRWRRALSERVHEPSATPDLIEVALEEIDRMLSCEH